MLDISAQLGTFDENLPPHIMAYLIEGWVENLARTNYIYLQMYPDTIALYDSGVFYQEEQPGYEDFFDIPTVLDQGFADCEDLVAWRAAEYWSTGHAAKPVVSWVMLPNGDLVFHVQLQTQFGIEDPSQVLGMQ
jgi:hypothetical protein